MFAFPTLSDRLRISLCSTLGAAVLLAAGVAVAQRPSQSGGGRNGSHPPRPSAEALAACKSLAAEAACSFSSDEKTVTGSCWAPEGKPLACKPTDAPSKGEPVAGQ